MPCRILPAPPQRVSFEEKKGDILIFQKDTLIRQAFPGAWRVEFFILLGSKRNVLEIPLQRLI
jgi:hypothetical protein